MNPMEKKYAKSAQKMIIFESGLAVSEMSQSKVEVLHHRMVEQYKVRLEEYNPVCDDNLHDNFTGRSYAFTLRDNHVEVFKKLIEETDGKKMWKAYTNLKSELVNHWLPHFRIQSGEDLDDAVERVRMHAWAYRANRNIKKNNRKAELEGREGEEEKISDDAPTGSITNVPLELPIVKKYHDHPFLQINLRASEDGSGEDSEKEEDGKFRSVVSSLKKRRQQRKDQKEGDKKSKGGIANDDSHKFEMQAAAANRQIAATESKNMIEFLRLAQESTVWTQGEMKDMFLSAKDTIFGKEKEKEKQPLLVDEYSPSTELDSDGEDLYV